ncbi:MAG: two-component sensor histidine kinase [Hyphomicrobiaceae bacterium]|nr:two-component sensor histidine kinase [Hyphomicrobiaceae bacterium]MCC0024349.1 two-component sensor histidine kinase [Hyphomicrobiaceae bacterium]
MNTGSAKRRPSITWRLVVGLSVFTGILWLGAAAIALSVLNAELTETFDQLLEQSAYRLLPLALHDMRERDEIQETRIPELSLNDELSFSYVVRDPNGRIIISSQNAETYLIPANPPEGFFDVGDRRAMTLTDRRSGFAIVVMEASGHRQRTLAEAAGTLLWPLTALVPLIAAGIWFAVRLAMRPVGRLRAEIAERGERNLERISAEGHPRELAPIAEELASLFERLKAALDAERAFAATSAHELRTPIAGALAQAQQLASELKDPGSAHRVDAIVASLRRLSNMSEKLLQTARADAGFARTDAASDMLPVLKLLAREPLPRGNVVELQIEEGADLVLPVNKDAFGMAIANLLQNASNHGEKGAPVRVVAGPGKVVAVINQGAIVDQAILNKLGQRFVRGETEADGTGLGLSLVRTIMEQTGGRLELLSPANGMPNGFEARLIWE